MSQATPLFQLLLTIHFIGLAFGLGGAAISDAAFAKSIRKADRISVETVNWMRTFSSLIWTGLGILALSGIGLFLLNPEKYLHSTAFAAKMLFVLILIINGLWLNFYTTARLTTFNFSDKYPNKGAAWKARKLSFVFGAISAVTWYSILFLAMFKSYVPWPFIAFIAIYLIMLTGAVIGSLILEQLLFLKFKQRKVPENINDIPLSVLSEYSSEVLAEIAQRSHATLPNQPRPTPATPQPSTSNSLPEQQ